MVEELSIRLATIDDMKNVFDLSNDDTVRQNSIHTEKIEWDSHVNWYIERIKKTDEPFFIIENKLGNLIGQVRFDKLGENYIISISVHKDFRGKGIASNAIYETTQRIKGNHIIAYINQHNIASERAFINAGYKKLEGTEFIENKAFLKYIY